MPTHKPFLSMADLATLMGYTGGKRRERAYRFCRKLEQSKGEPILIRLGGEVKTTSWVVPYSAIRPYLVNDVPLETIEAMQQQLDHLTTRVETLEALLSRAI